MLEIDTSEQSKTFNKTQFMPFDIGKHRVRLLSSSRRVFTHYLKGKGTIECLGSECPICQKNKLIAVSNETPEKVPGYNKASLRYYFNVLDKTLVKVCPNCQTENKSGLVNFLPTCNECGTIITDITPIPSGKVKVINISKTNAEILNTIQASNLDTERNPIGLENYDVEFTVIMSGKQKNILPSANVLANDKVEIPADALFDLEKVVIHLEPDEVESLVSGVSLKDIFAARKGVASEFEEQMDEVNQEVTDAVNSLFKE